MLLIFTAVLLSRKREMDWMPRETLLLLNADKLSLHPPPLPALAQGQSLPEGRRQRAR